MIDGGDSDWCGGGSAASSNGDKRKRKEKLMHTEL